MKVTVKTQMGDYEGVLKDGIVTVTSGGLAPADERLQAWNAAWINAAQDHARDGELEVDENAIVSDSDNGAYVAAWLWVDGMRCSKCGDLLPPDWHCDECGPGTAVDPADYEEGRAATTASLF